MPRQATVGNGDPRNGHPAQPDRISVAGAPGTGRGRVLVLNATYEPLSVVPARRAACLVLAEKAELVECDGLLIRSASLTLASPLVIRLRYMVKVPYRRKASLSRRGVFARDDYRCQYCGDGFPTNELTFDHVLPVAQGGRKDWANIVTCCVTCNRRKGGRTPAEARMHLLRLPKRPESAPAIRITVGLRNAPESWRDYLYWNVELDDT